MVMQTRLRLTKFYDQLPKCLKITSSPTVPALPHVYHMQYVIDPMMHGRGKANEL
jgi:hypothetical protein